MGSTPEWLQEKVRAYYRATNEKSYLGRWSGEALSFHYGLADATTASLDEAHHNANAYVADHLGITAGAYPGRSLQALDSGCGVGGTSIWMARERGATMTALTIDPQQALLGAGYAAQHGVSDRVRYVVGDYMNSGLPHGSFDRVFNVESLCHCADLGAYFTHLSDLLAPGGLYGCLEFFRATGAPDKVAAVMETWAMPEWASIDEVAGALERVGFVDVQTTDLTPDVRRTAEQMIAMARNSQLVMRLDQAVGGPPESDVYVGHVRGAIACSEALLEGGATYGFVRATRPVR
jgi:tocopherol O-methyltransferase